MGSAVSESQHPVRDIGRAAIAAIFALTLVECARVNPASPGITTSQVSSSGSAMLTWTPVTSNTDGTALEDLAGYHVHYGASATQMSTLVVLADPNQTNYVVYDLGPGTWYFTVAAYTDSGIEGLSSNVATKVIAPAQ